MAHLLAIEGDQQTAEGSLLKGKAWWRPIPESRPSFNVKGQVLYLAGQRAEALEALQTAKNLAKQLQVNSDSDLGQAISALERVLENSPDLGQNSERKLQLLEAERLLELGHVEEVQSRLGEAQKCFEQALQITRKWDHVSENVKGAFLHRFYSSDSWSKRPSAYVLFRSLRNSEADRTPSCGNVELGEYGGHSFGAGRSERAMECLIPSLRCQEYG